MGLPSWGTPEIKDNVVRVRDKKGVSIFRYRLPIIVEKDKQAFRKVKDAKGFDIEERTEDTEDAEFEIDGKKLYIKPKKNSKLKYPLRAYDDSDTSSTHNIDADIREWQQSTNLGSNTYLQPYTASAPDYSRVVEDWTLSAGSGTITNVSLFHYAYAQSQTNGYTLDVHELTQASSMVENQVTWLIWKTGSSWSSPGGDYSGTIIDSVTRTGATTVWDEFVLFGAGATNPMDGSGGSTALDWGVNFDIILKWNSEGDIQARWVSYRSKEYGSGNNPYIEITYAPSGWANIAKVGGVTATDLAKVDGIAVADIAKINGVAV